MAKAMVIRTHGSADVMQLEEVPRATPRSGELRIRQTAIGVNFHDIYVRAGLYTR